MSNRHLRVAVIGCGTIGRIHLRAYRQDPSVEIAAICDLEPSRLDAAGREFDVLHRFEDYRQLLDVDRYDLISVCTMPVSHREIAVAALAAGANVLCEKPPAVNADEVVAMIAAARSTGRLLSFGFNMRFLPGAQVLKRFVAEGGIGRPIATRAWTFANDIPWWGKHYVKRISGGGVLASTAVHILDLALWVAGNPRPLTASASMARVFPGKRAASAPDAEATESFDVEDTFSGHIRFADGSWMTLEGGWAWDRLDYSYSFEMTGDTATIQLEPLQVVAERDGVPTDITAEVIPAGGLPASTWVDQWHAAIDAEIADIIAAIRSGRQPVVTAEEALTVQAIVDALYQSAALGREVDIEIPSI